MTEFRILLKDDNLIVFFSPSFSMEEIERREVYKGKYYGDHIFNSLHDKKLDTE